MVRMPKPQSTLRCPTCRKLATRSEVEYPFCSERCRLIDLGKWASGGYVISTPITDPESLENAALNDVAERQQRRGKIGRDRAADGDDFEND